MNVNETTSTPTNGKPIVAVIAYYRDGNHTGAERLAFGFSSGSEVGDGKSISFPMNEQTWGEDGIPKEEKGMLVVLTGISAKTAGWRADRARLYRPEDDKDPDLLRQKQEIREQKEEAKAFRSV